MGFVSFAQWEAQILKRAHCDDDVLHMNRQPQILPTKRGLSAKRGTRPEPMREHLVLCYRLLSEAYEAVQGISLSAESDINEANVRGAVAVIIEEDLRSLLEECEGFLLESGAPNPSGLSSFEARSLTVIEEVNSIISLLLPKQSDDVWH